MEMCMQPAMRMEHLRIKQETGNRPQDIYSSKHSLIQIYNFKLQSHKILIVNTSNQGCSGLVFMMKGIALPSG